MFVHVTCRLFTCSPCSPLSPAAPISSLKENKTPQPLLHSYGTLRLGHDHTLPSWSFLSLFLIVRQLLYFSDTYWMFYMCAITTDYVKQYNEHTNLHTYFHGKEHLNLLVIFLCTIATANLLYNRYKATHLLPKYPFARISHSRASDSYHLVISIKPASFSDTKVLQYFSFLCVDYYN